MILPGPLIPPSHPIPLCHPIPSRLGSRTKDRLVSYGERLSVRMMAAALNKAGLPSQHFDAWALGMRTNNDFGNAEVLDESYSLIRETLSKFDPNM